MKYLVWITVFLVWQGKTAVADTGAKDKAVRLEPLLPPEVQGWAPKGEDSVYTPQTIFNYINGAGEVYRSYNFKQLQSRRYTRKGQPDIIADIFDMGSSRDAFGVFTHDLEGSDASIGQGSANKGELLSFWKDRFFISLFAEGETRKSREALQALGRLVASSIKKEGRIPDIVTILPRDKLLDKSLRYFHNHSILNFHFFVADENILLLDQETEAALGAYGDRDSTFHILLVRYSDELKAGQAGQAFKQAYMPEAVDQGRVKTENGKWTAVKVYNQWLIIIFDSPSSSHAGKVLLHTEKRVRKDD